ncbi:unnamed protein product [Pleuronectes platessa]|uniref:Uncharacterized protein n=1 Tax=Pleuronectes platessa TaxID=8262 RepID=A0A9N7Y758_PLEPL|nr:unnamed protein product [Pleuronectes platessa]
MSKRNRTTTLQPRAPAAPRREEERRRRKMSAWKDEDESKGLCAHGEGQLGHYCTPVTRPGGAAVAHHNNESVESNQRPFLPIVQVSATSPPPLVSAHQPHLPEDRPQHRQKPVGALYLRPGANEGTLEMELVVGPRAGKRTLEGSAPVSLE